MASKHCVPILADEIYSDMVSPMTYRHVRKGLQVGLALGNTSETHFLITMTAEVVLHLVVFALGFKSWVDKLTSAHGGLRALCGE